jgi:hypothetical protein
MNEEQRIPARELESQNEGTNDELEGLMQNLERARARSRPSSKPRNACRRVERRARAPGEVEEKLENSWNERPSASSRALPVDPGPGPSAPTREDSVRRRARGEACQRARAEVESWGVAEQAAMREAQKRCASRRTRASSTRSPIRPTRSRTVENEIDQVPAARAFRRVTAGDEEPADDPATTSDPTTRIPHQLERGRAERPEFAQIDPVVVD